MGAPLAQEVSEALDLSRETYNNNNTAKALFAPAFGFGITPPPATSSIFVPTQTSIDSPITRDSGFTSIADIVSTTEAALSESTFSYPWPDPTTSPEQFNSVELDSSPTYSNPNSALWPSIERHDPGDPETAGKKYGGVKNQKNVDRRVRIRPKNDSLYGSGLLQVIKTTNGCIFPYTPTINISHTANWSPYQLVHTNYHTQTYTNTAIDDIMISGVFTAQDENEAVYAHAAIHFFKTMTKMYFGKDTANRGAPPPVLLLSGHGKDVFDDIPVVIKSFTMDYNQEADMVQVPNSTAWIPMKFMVSVSLGVSHNMQNVRDNFNLSDFRNGNILKGFI